MVTALNTALTAGARAGGDTSASVVVGRIKDGTTVVYIDQVLAASFPASRRRLSARALAPTMLQVDYKAIFASPSAAGSFSTALASSPTAFASTVAPLLAASGGAFNGFTASAMTTKVMSTPAAPSTATPAEGLSTAGVIAIAVVLGGGGFILIICGYFFFCRGKKPADDDGGKDAPTGGLTVRAVGSSPRSPKVAPHSDA